MPNVDIVSLPLSLKGFPAKKLIGKLTGVFCEKAGCPADAVHLRFHSVDTDHYYIGGARDDRPLSHTTYPDRKAIFEINVAWYAGRSPDTQAEVAQGLTEAVVSILRIPAGNVEINFSELRPGNHFEGGKRAPAPK